MIQTHRRYRKKSIVVEAVHFTGLIDRHYLPGDIAQFLGDAGVLCHERGESRIHTLEGDLHVSVGDWIIKGIKGEFYPCKPDIFEATYDWDWAFQLGPLFGP